MPIASFMRGLLFLGLLLGLLYYAFLSKESAQENMELLSSVRGQVSDIAERENERFRSARSCSSGDDEEAADCLQRSYSSDSGSRRTSDSASRPISRPSTSAHPSSARSALKHLPLRSGTSSVPDF